jgi:hypothetical protein
MASYASWTSSNRVAAGGEDVGGAPDSQVASRLQRTSRCEVTHLGVDPVPGGCGNHSGVRAGLTAPILEASLDDG